MTLIPVELEGESGGRRPREFVLWSPIEGRTDLVVEQLQPCPSSTTVL